LTNTASARFSIDLDKLSPLTISNRNIYFGSSSLNTKSELNETPKETNMKPEQPVELTHYEDFDDEDEDSDETLSQHIPK
jgi:hypothetical protein